jgi:hypothetical protein
VGEIKGVAMTDPAAIAGQVVDNATATALLAQTVDSGFKAVDKGMTQVAAEQKDQAQRLEKLLGMIHDMQIRSSGFERFGNDLIAMREEFRTWRAEHEAANNDVAKDVNQFKGALKFWGAISTLVVALFSALAYWGISARFDQNLVIDGKQNEQIDKLETQVTELKATRGAR